MLGKAGQIFTNRADELECLRARVAQLEEQLAHETDRHSGDRYRRLVETVRLIAWEFDPATKRFDFVSQYALDILGYPQEAWKEPAFWYNHLHPDDREGVAQFCRENAARCRNHELEYRMVRANGSIAWIKDITTVQARDGKPVRLHGVFIDVTDRKLAEDQLRQSEQRFRQLAESSNVGFWQVSPEGHTIYINPAMCSMLDVGGPSDMIGRTFHEFFDRESLERIKVEHAKRAAGISSTYEVDAVTARGRRRTLLIAGAPLMKPDGTLLSKIGTFMDITDHKQAEEARREGAELQRMMLSELDHRVRNNLAALGALIDISMRDKTDVREFAASIRGRVQAMSAVHSLLSRAHWLAVSLRSLIETLTPADLHESVAADGPDVLITPRQVTALGMILQELFANSLKYGALGAPRGRAELKWTVHDDVTNAKGVRLELTWHEREGPPIQSQPKPGQGTGLILGFVRSELRGSAELAYPREGALHRFTLNLDPAVSAP